MSASNSAPSCTSYPASSLQCQLAYEKEKLSELRRQVAVQEERFSSMQQQFETLSSDNDTAGWKSSVKTLSLYILTNQLELSYTAE